MAWTHSTSSIVSSPVLLTGAVGVPGCETILNVGSPATPSIWGRPYWLEKTERSLVMVGTW